MIVEKMLESFIKFFQTSLVIAATYGGADGLLLVGFFFPFSNIMILEL